ncbi:type II secretion system protein [Candidatus Uhrbacteria bacterium]|nr:type II secretion system protein [Candidatus Uhrbacteria bacterium]
MFLNHHKKSNAVGFTLLELLIVIGIMVILGTVLVLVLNPAEALKKARDNQRISDLQTLKTAIGLFITEVSGTNLDLDGTTLSSVCLTNPAGTATANAQIFYSAPFANDPSCSASLTPGSDAETGSDFSAADFCRYATAANYTKVDSNGWIPVDLTQIRGGSPISNLPLDPTNTIASVNGSIPTSTDFVYRYGCQNGVGTSSTKSAYLFEIDAPLESTTYAGKKTSDGGDNDTFYEVGNSLRILPTETTNW